ncbi:MAG: M15 family metallopeptidase [Rhodospirillales bacterium]
MARIRIRRYGLPARRSRMRAAGAQWRNGRQACWSRSPGRYDVDIDLAYATAENFTGAAIYRRHARCWLHPDTAILLARAASLARRLGLRLRSSTPSARRKRSGCCGGISPIRLHRRSAPRSPHSMGAAVDLTLVEGPGGPALDMGTGFDDMRPLSWHGDTIVPAAAQRNRALLLGLMTAAGFDFYRNEWWHYQLFQPRGRYPVLSDTVLPEPMM